MMYCGIAEKISQAFILAHKLANVLLFGIGYNSVENFRLVRSAISRSCPDRKVPEQFDQILKAEMAFGQSLLQIQSVDIGVNLGSILGSAVVFIHQPQQVD